MGMRVVGKADLPANVGTEPGVLQTYLDAMWAAGWVLVAAVGTNLVFEAREDRTPDRSGRASGDLGFD